MLIAEDVNTLVCVSVVSFDEFGLEGASIE